MKKQRNFFLNHENEFYLILFIYFYVPGKFKKQKDVEYKKK